ncbi:hypothetical protein [Alysiella crassa]|uniref:Uncharacterized protein n=1 Tax=Alysiella crassa TaxID=153491 RepID=A0A376BK88_9NEIS|nr:hypothetical protein [Alysiella crassa]UOP07725.1 hypothetical protein LVJ80_05060 [Alysiella crassa]SSY70035.1 Uncharacterised protein [Alysiella crassa]
MISNILLYGGGGLIVGYLLGEWASYQRYSPVVQAISAQLDDTQTELAAAEKQIEAQGEIYRRLEMRLAKNFSKNNQQVDDKAQEVVMTPPRPVIRPEYHRRRVRQDGLLISEVHY